MNVREHINEEQQKEIVGDGRPYEVQLEERILKHVAKFSNLTIAGLKSRLGAYVPEAVILQVLDRLVGKRQSKHELDGLTNVGFC